MNSRHFHASELPASRNIIIVDDQDEWASCPSTATCVFSFIDTDILEIRPGFVESVVGLENVRRKAISLRT